MMFPVSLDFSLSERIEKQELQSALRKRFPGLVFGVEADLLKHSQHWPDAVVAVRHEEDVPYPTSVDFVHFPRRSRTDLGDAVMPPTKLALLRELSVMFECRVLCGASEFWNDEDVDSRYDSHETFICLGGRIFSGALDSVDASLGAKPAAGWEPVNRHPFPGLLGDATILDEANEIREMINWRRTRSAPSANSAVIYPEGMIDMDGDEDTFESGDRPSWGKLDFSADRDFDDDEDTEEEMEDYFQQIDQWTEGKGPTGSKQLISDGIALPSPDTLNDRTLKVVLWRVINGLARRNTYLHGTNHLSDRQLYQWMWHDMLNETTIDIAGFSSAALHVSPIGSGSDEDVRQTQIYYDDGVARARWKASWPGDEIPAHQDPPFDRDRHLPRKEGPEWL